MKIGLRGEPPGGKNVANEACWCDRGSSFCSIRLKFEVVINGILVGIDFGEN